MGLNTCKTPENDILLEVIKSGFWATFHCFNMASEWGGHIFLITFVYELF